jgi:hypothetical protein
MSHQRLVDGRSTCAPHGPGVQLSDFPFVGIRKTVPQRQPYVLSSSPSFAAYIAVGRSKIAVALWSIALSLVRLQSLCKHLIDHTRVSTPISGNDTRATRSSRSVCYLLSVSSTVMNARVLAIWDAGNGQERDF